MASSLVDDFEMSSKVSLPAESDDEAEFSDAPSVSEGKENEDKRAKRKRFNTSGLTEKLDTSGDSAGSTLEMLREDMKTVKLKMDDLAEEIGKLSSVMERLEAQEKHMVKVNSEVIKLDDGIQDVSRNVKKVEAEVNDQKSDVTCVKGVVQSCEARVRDLEEKCIDLEGRSRRNNLLFHGLKEDDREDGGFNSVQFAKDFIRSECKVPDEVVIERAHRIGKSRRSMVGRKANEPRPFIVAFNRYTDKQFVKKCAKDNLPDTISCADDLPFAVRQARRKLTARFEAAKRDKDVNDVYIAHPARLIVNGEFVASVNPATGEVYERHPGRQTTSDRHHNDNDRRYTSDQRYNDDDRRNTSNRRYDSARPNDSNRRYDSGRPNTSNRRYDYSPERQNNAGRRYNPERRYDSVQQGTRDRDHDGDWEYVSYSRGGGRRMDDDRGDYRDNNASDYRGDRQGRDYHHHHGDNYPSGDRLNRKGRY